jgi:hypothetical protein
VLAEDGHVEEEYVDRGPNRGGRPTTSLGEITGSMTPFPAGELRRSRGTPDGYLAAARGWPTWSPMDGSSRGTPERMLARAAAVTF